MFKIVSSYRPSGDQPKAIKQLTKNIVSGKKFQTLLGVTGSGKTFTVANVIEETQKPTLVIAHNKTLAAQLASELRQFFPKSAVEYFVSYYDYYQPEAYLPSTDTFIEKDLEINEEIDRLRHAATAALLSRKDVIIVASVSCIYGLGSPEFYQQATFQIQKGQKADRKEIIRSLIEMQYQRSELLVRSKFRVRGDVFEIMRPDREIVIRIEMENKKVEKIMEYDHLTGEILSEKLDQVFIFPAKHFVVPEPLMQQSIEQIRSELKQRLGFFQKQRKIVEMERLRRRTEHDLEMMQELGYCSGIENYSLYLSGRKKGESPYTLIDYFPDDFLTVVDESHVTIPQLHAMFGGDYSRKKNLVEHGFRLPSAFDNRPLKFSEFEQKIGQTIFVSATPSKYELQKSQIADRGSQINKGVVEQIVRPTGLVDPEIEIRPCKSQVKDVIREIGEIADRQERTLITTLTKKMAEDLAEFLKETGIKSEYLHSNVDTLDRIRILEDLRRGKFDVLVGVNLLREGLDLPEVSLVTILDADKEGFLRSETSLIQTIGRAARNVRGRVILYADSITGSMKRAIDETERRRKLQSSYNKKHGITPKTIEKKIKSIIDFEINPQKEFNQEFLNLEKYEDVSGYIKQREREMKDAAKRLEFEKAALIRDEIGKLRRLQLKK
jgi:excinuclease ABC subunit B